MPGYEALQWDGIVAPRNTPAQIVDRLNAEINAGLADPTMRTRLASGRGETKHDPRGPGGHDMQGVKDASGLYEVERRDCYAARPGFRIVELQISPVQKVPWHYHNKVLWTIRLCGAGPGQSGRSSPSRASRRTDFITSLAALKETMPSPGGCAGGAWKSSSLRRDEVPIQQRGTA